MKDFLVKVLGICLILSIFNLWYLTIAGASIVAIVLNSFLEVRERSYKQEEEKIKALQQDVRDAIKELQSEQGVLKLKIQNLMNPGRKL
jgi:hypothetical protein